VVLNAAPKSEWGFAIEDADLRKI